MSDDLEVVEVGTVSTNDPIISKGVVLVQSYVDRINRLEDEKKDLGEDIRSIYAEAKSSGLDTKTLRAVVKLCRLEDDEREAAQALIDLYMGALGKK